MTDQVTVFSYATMSLLVTLAFPSTAQVVGPTAPGQPWQATAPTTAPTPAPAPAVAPPPPTAATVPPPTAIQPLTAAPVAATPAPIAPPPGYVLVPVGSTVAPAPETPQEVPYESGEPVPSGYHVEEQMRNGLVIAGSLTLGIPWVFSATAAVGKDFEDKSGYLMVPALGPWLMLAAGGAKDPCSSASDRYCDDKSSTRAWLFLDGVTQAAGAIMLATGLYYPRKRLVRDHFAWSLAPTTVGNSGYGIGASGAF